MTQRDFEIRLSKLVMESFAANLKQDDLIAALENKLSEEQRLRQDRRAAARFY